MKKLYACLLAGSMTMAANAQLYVTGGDYGWDPEDPVTVEAVDGVYTFNVTTTFKMSTQKGDWPEFNAAALCLSEDAPVEQEFTVGLGLGDSDILLPYEANWTVSMPTDLKTATFKADVAAPTGPIIHEIYVRGTMTDNFGVDDDWKFSTTDGVVYTLTGKTIDATDSFKIADANWGKVNYGLSFGEEAMELNTPTVLSYNSSSNISLAEGGENLTLTFNLDTATLTVATVGNGGGESGDDLVYNIFGNIFNGATWLGEQLTLTDGKYVLADAEVVSGNFGIQVLDLSRDTDDQQVGWYASAGEADVVLDSAMSIADTDCQNFFIYGGTYTFTLDMAAMTLTVTGNQTVFPTEGFDGWIISLAGDFNSWDASDEAATVEVKEDGTAQIKSDRVASGEFKFVLVKGALGQGWYTAGADLEANTEYTLFTEGGNMSIVDGSPDNLYTFDFDFSGDVYTVKMTCEDGAGVEEVAEVAVDAMYFNLQGARVDNPADGIYVKVVGGKASKVMIRR
ncbi:MAG: hypothetical protein HDR80_11185 [Bacteroides sp.]|nr:hypothetical protein [Bacteroides sp.]